MSALVKLYVPPGFSPEQLDGLKALLERAPSGLPVLILVGQRRLTLGERYNVDPTPEVVAAMSEFGTVMVKD